MGGGRMVGGIEGFNPEEEGLVPSGTIEEGEEREGISRLVEVPEMFFRQLSERLGIGEEYDTYPRGSHYRCRLLDPDHPKVGFKGAIGFRKVCDQRVFVLWLWPPDNSKNHGFMPDECFELIAGPMDQGVWAMGRTFVKEELKVARSGRDMKADCLAIPLVAELLLLAHRIATEPSLKVEEYWTGDGKW
jgi:hypothetical protein